MRMQKSQPAARAEELNYISFAMFGWSLYYILRSRRVLQNGRVVQIYRMHCQFAWHGAAIFFEKMVMPIAQWGQYWGCSETVHSSSLLCLIWWNSFIIVYYLPYHWSSACTNWLLIPIFLSFSFVFCVCVCLSVCQSLYLFYFLLPPPP